MPDFNLALDAIVPPGPAGDGGYYLKAGVPLVPVLIDPVNDGIGAQSVNSIIPFGGKLFRFLLNKASVAGSIDMWTSVDNGVTWGKTAGPAIAHGTSPGNNGDFFSIYWDGTSNLVVICYPVDGISGALQFSSFDMNAGIFSAAYGVGGPSAITCPGLAKRADGSLVAGYTAVQNGHTRLFAAVFQSVWGAPVELSAPVPVTSDVGQPQFIFDPNSQIFHAFIPTTSAAPALVHQAQSFSNAGTTVIPITAAALGHTLVVFGASVNSTPIVSVTCTNVIFTKQVSGQFAELWVGVVVGGVSGAAVTVQWAGVNSNVASAIEFSGVVQFDGGAALDGLTATVTFTVNGTWTAPAGVTQITIEAWGAGGNGGNNSPSMVTGGGGGGGGGYGTGTAAVIPGHVYNVTVAQQHPFGPSGDPSFTSANGAIFGQTGGNGDSNGIAGTAGPGSTSLGDSGNNSFGPPGGDGGNSGAGTQTGIGGAGGFPGQRGTDGTVPGGGGGGGGYQAGIKNPGGLGAQGLVKITYLANQQTAPYTSTGYDLILACLGIKVSAVPTSQPAGYTALATADGAPDVSLQANYLVTPTNVPGGAQSAAWTYAVPDSWTALIIGLRAASNVNWYVPFSGNSTGTAFQFPNPLGTNTLPSFAFGLGDLSVGSRLGISVQTIDPVSGHLIPGIYFGTPTVGPIWTLDTSIDSAAIGDNSNNAPGQLISDLTNSIDYLFWLAAAPGHATGITIVWFSSNTSGAGWTPRVSIFNAVADDPAGLGSVAGQRLRNFGAAFAVVAPPVPPPPTLQQPASAVSNIPTRPNLPLFLHFEFLAPLNLLPNDYDLCLLRDWRQFNKIKWRPITKAAIAYSEEGWDAEGTPYGTIVFNPDRAIPLPAPGDGNVPVLSFRVPVAYDGLILGQYQAYRGSGRFIEGSGDLVWRVRVDGRYLRDMGNMQTSLGSPQRLSTCPGGLWVQSNSLVEYLVAAPNLSGNLPLPGQGFILAGLHGHFFPRVCQ